MRDAGKDVIALREKIKEERERMTESRTDEKRELIRAIIEREWSMFRAVQNEGGRAACQDDAETFRIMRGSQFLTWNVTTLASYRADLERAEKEGRDLITEKYGYMMRSTAPDRYEEIRTALPPVPEEKAALVEEIVSCEMAWAERFAGKYPRLAATGRPLHTTDDSTLITSQETYLRGELSTYSQETLEQYLLWCRTAEKAGRNLCEETMEHTVRAYGYPTLDVYEERSKAKL